MTKEPVTNGQNTEDNQKNDDNTEEEVDAKSIESQADSKTEDESQEEGLRVSVNELKNTIDRLTETLANVDTKFRIQESRIQFLETRCETLENQNKKLNERVNHLENVGKLLNIKIDGIKEKNGEDLTHEILKLAGVMGSNCQATEIDYVFRMGKKQEKQLRPRTIMVKFKSMQARHEFYNARFQLKSKKEWERVWINDDVSEQTRRRREAMRAITILCRDSRTDCKLRSDSIIIKGRKYWIDELEQIPHPFFAGGCKDSRV